MADREQFKILKEGVEAWNKWRRRKEEVFLPSGRFCPDLKKANLIVQNLSEADLSRADLSGANLSGANLTRANLRKANLRGAYLRGANLRGAELNNAVLNGAYLVETDFSGANLSAVDLSGMDLRKANLSRAILWMATLSGANLSSVNLNRANLGKAYIANSDLSGAILSYANLFEADLTEATLKGADLVRVNLSEADMSGADLSGADLNGANLSKADLSGAELVETDLSRVSFVEAKLEGANLSNSCIYGISAWNMKTNQKTKQLSLVITPPEEPIITVDNLEVAQFIYLLLNNEKIRDVINTITTKVILILGRFTKSRKNVLDAIRDELRKQDYLPILFDFNKPATRDIQETVTTLARMARFVIADITNPRSIPQELVSIVQELPSLPIKPLLRYGAKPWEMYDHIKRYPWVLEIYKYRKFNDLLGSLQEKVISPAESKARELEVK
jgi:uncharacterized protein YjbI with pentapeptide repeats